MNLATVFNRLETRRLELSLALKDKAIAIYKSKYLDEFNIVTFFIVDPETGHQIVFFLFVQINENNGKNEYHSIVHSRSSGGDSWDYWVDNILVSSYSAEPLRRFDVATHLMTTNLLITELTTDDDYPDNALKKFDPSAVIAENIFKTVTGLPFSFVSNQTFNWVRAL